MHPLIKALRINDLRKVFLVSCGCKSPSLLLRVQKVRRVHGSGFPTDFPSSPMLVVEVQGGLNRSLTGVAPYCVPDSPRTRPAAPPCRHHERRPGSPIGGNSGPTLLRPLSRPPSPLQTHHQRRQPSSSVSPLRGNFSGHPFPSHVHGLGNPKITEQPAPQAPSKPTRRRPLLKPLGGNCEITLPQPAFLVPSESPSPGTPTAVAHCVPNLRKLQRPPSGDPSSSAPKDSESRPKNPVGTDFFSQ